MSFILADGWLITMNERRQVLEDASVYIRGDRIVGIGTRAQLAAANPIFLCPEW